MGYKYDEAEQHWVVWHSKRHPITRTPMSLRRIGFKSEAEAKRIERQLIIEVEERLHGKVVPKWIELVEDYRKASIDKGMTLKTVDNYYVCLAAHTFDRWGDKYIDRITTDEVRNLIKEKVGHRSPSHQKNVLKFIRGAFKYAQECGHIHRNPVPEMKFRTGDKIRKALTEDQVRTLLDKAKEYRWEWYPHVAMALYTGMRNGELYSVTWNKINFVDRNILVDSSWNKKDGFKSTKTGNDRIIEIAPNLMNILLDLKTQNPDSNFVLPRISQWDEGYQASALRMFLIGLGLPSIRFHDLRATWATIMLSKGIQPAKVMVMGGWNDIKTLMIYLRKAGIDIKGITDCLNLHNV
jgi:integrase